MKGQNRRTGRKTKEVSVEGEGGRRKNNTKVVCLIPQGILLFYILQTLIKLCYLG